MHAMTGRSVESGERYLALDGLRGLAAVMVVFYHFGLSTRQHVDAGYLAVDFFFVLSGFVIADSYGAKLQQRMSFARFAKIRAIRLYPMYFAGTVIGLASKLLLPLVGAIKATSWHALVVMVPMGLAMIPTPAEQLFPLNSPAWSLFVELVVNVAFALFLVRLRSRWLLALILLAALSLAFGIDAPRYMDVGPTWGTLPLGIARSFYSFTIGILFQRHVRLSRFRTWLAAIPMIVLCLMLACPSELFMQPARDLVFALVLCPVLVLAGMKWEAPRAAVTACKFLGDLSYPLYVVHRPLAAGIKWACQQAHLPIAIATGVFLIVSVVVAWLLARWFDAPVRNYLSVKFGLRESAKPQAVADN